MGSIRVSWVLSVPDQKSTCIKKFVKEFQYNGSKFVMSQIGLQVSINFDSSIFVIYYGVITFNC